MRKLFGLSKKSANIRTNQSGIAHLGLVLAVVFVVGIIGIASYSVFHKPQSNSAQLNDLDSKIIKDQLKDLAPGLKNGQALKISEADFKAKVDGLSDEQLNGLVSDDGTINEAQFNKLFGDSFYTTDDAKTRVSSLLSKKLNYVTKNDNKVTDDNKKVTGSTVNENPSNNDSGVIVNLDERSDTGDSEDSSSSDNGNSSSGNSASSPSDDESNQSSNDSDNSSDNGSSSGNKCSMPHQAYNKSSGACLDDCGYEDVQYYLTDNPNGNNGCVTKDKCPGGKVVGGTTQHRCVRGNVGANVDQKKCTSADVGRVYKDGCQRVCQNTSKFLTNYANGALDKCVSSWTQCKLGKGWTASNPGFAIVGGVNKKCYAEGSTPQPSASGPEKGTMSCTAAEKAGIVSGKYACAKSTDERYACLDYAAERNTNLSKDLYLPKFTFVSTKDKKKYTYDLCLNAKKYKGEKVIQDGFRCREVASFLKERGYVCPDSDTLGKDECPKNTTTLNNYSFATDGKSYKIRVCKNNKSTGETIACSQYLNKVNTYYYQCPKNTNTDPNKACPPKKAGVGLYLSTPSILKTISGTTITPAGICKYTYYGNNPDTGPKEKAGCEGYLKRVWNDKTKKCAPKCLKNYEYWRTITSGEYKGWRQCRVIVKGDDGKNTSSVSPSFCKKLKRTHYFDGGGNGRCGGCSPSSLMLSSEKDHNWSICKSKDDKKDDDKGSSSDVGSKCGIANSTAAYTSGKYCAKLRTSSACKGTYNGHELEWEFPGRKDGKKAGFHICNINGL